MTDNNNHNDEVIDSNTDVTGEDADLVLVEQAERYSIISLNRPSKRNALSHGMLDAIYSAMDSLPSDDRHIVVLTGNGPAFCAGADLTPFQSIETNKERQELLASYGRGVNEIMQILASPNLISICAINGPAVGGGWALAMACDFRIAGINASFWFPEIELGRILGEPALLQAVNQAGAPLAKEMIMLAKRYESSELLSLGQLNRVVEENELLETAFAYAERLANMDAQALTGVKYHIDKVANTR